MPERRKRNSVPVSLNGAEFYSLDQWKKKSAKWNGICLIQARIFRQMPYEQRREIGEDILNSLEEFYPGERRGASIYGSLLKLSDEALDKFIKSQQK